MRVLLVDDHAVVGAGFRMLLSAQNFIDEVMNLDRGEKLSQEYEIFKPDVVVMDLSMPGIGGLEAIRRLVKQDENAVVLVYSIHDEMIYVDRALASGAKGYVTKNSAPEILAEAVQSVAQGKQYIESGLKAKIDEIQENNIDQYREVIDLLSAREFDVFCLLANGKNAHEISQKLHLSYKTVANYGTQIKQKINVRTSADLAKVAMVLGVIKH